MKNILRVLKTICLATVLGVACLSLTSCDEKDSAHTITFYTSMGDKLLNTLEVAKKEFAEKFPGWQVEVVNPGGGYDGTRSAIVGDLQANSQPDLAYCYADHVAQYLVTSKVTNMANYINNSNKLTVNVKEGDDYVSKTYDEIVGYTAEEVADFVEGYYKEGFASNYANYSTYGYSENDILTVPFQKSTEILYYNAEALIELGYYEEKDGKKIATPPATWDELWEICRAAKAKWPNSTPMGYDSESNWFITMCEQNGWGYTSASEPHYLFNNAEAQAWLGELNSYFNEKLFTTQEIYGAYSSNLFTKGAETGSILSIGSSGGASYQDPGTKFKWGVAPIPGSVQEDGSVVRKAISQGPSLCLFKSDNVQQVNASWLLMKYLTTNVLL